MPKHYRNKGKNNRLSKPMEKKVKRIVKRIVDNDEENKWVCYTKGAGAVTSNFATAGLPVIQLLGANSFTQVGAYDPQTDSHGMLGTAITCKYFELGYSLYIDDSVAEDCSAEVRMLVVWDNEPAADTSFTSTLSLYSSGSNYDDIVLRDGYIHAQPYATLTKLGERSPRFTILYDKIHRLGATGNGPLYQSHRATINLHNKKLNFSQTNLGTAYPTTANLLVFPVTLANDASVVVNSIISTRMWYQDA